MDYTQERLLSYQLIHNKVIHQILSNKSCKPYQKTKKWSSFRSDNIAPQKVGILIQQKYKNICPAFIRRNDISPSTTPVNQQNITKR